MTMAWGLEAHVPFLDWWSMVRVAPKLIRLRSYNSVYSMVSRFIRDSHLRQAFSFHSLLVGGNPFRTSAIYTLIHALERKWGVFFPRGGTGCLVGVDQSPVVCAEPRLVSPTRGSGQ